MLFRSARCQDYASEVVMTPVERGLFQKIRDWWNNLLHSSDLKYKEGVFDGVTELFDKVWDKGHKIVWTDEWKPIIEGVRREVSDAFMDEMTLWQGSTRIFPKFLNAFLGSGEGAHMRGWGHYFATAREVAEWYARRLGGGNAGPNRTLNSRALEQISPRELRDAYDRLRLYQAREKLPQSKDPGVLDLTAMVEEIDAFIINNKARINDIDQVLGNGLVFTRNNRSYMKLIYLIN